MQTPLYDHLIKYHNQKRISFAMPGHKDGRGLAKNLLDCDVTELDKTEDLHKPGEIIKKSQKLISNVYNMEHSYILTGGSTAGIQSMIAGVAMQGKILLASPDCHMSVVNTCAIMGIQMMIAPMEYDAYGHCVDFDKGNLKELLSQNNICAVITVSPDYYGVCKKLQQTMDICHSHNVPLLIDSAHGAHFAMSDNLPDILKADCVVMSAHKTLNALNGASFLHINGDIIDRASVCRAMGMFQSSSPSYVVASSAELSVLKADKNSWEHTISKCNELKNRLKMPFLPNDDATRLVIFTGKKTGFEIEKALADEFGIDIEMADSNCIVLIATPSNTDEDFEVLYKALKNFEHSEITPVKNIKPLVKGVFNPANGFLSATEDIDMVNSVGRISATTITAYPPGIPIIYCGTEITQEMVDAIVQLKNDGAKITGMENDIIKVTI